MKGKIPALAKRSLALALALALLLSLCPVLPLTAKAAAHTDGWSTTSSYTWLKGAFNTADEDLVFEDDQPYDWTFTIQQARVDANVGLSATIKDANGTTISTFEGTRTAYKSSNPTVMLAAEDFPELTTDLAGKFTLTCTVSYNGSPIAQLVQSFTRTTAGGEPEVTTEGAEVETTEGAEVETTVATEPDATEPGVDELKEGWTSTSAYTWINAAFNSADDDLVFEGEQPYDWNFTLQQERANVQVGVQAVIKDTNGNVVSTVTKTADANKSATPSEILNASEFAELAANYNGEYILVCDVTYNGNPVGRLVKRFSRTGGVDGEGGETPDEPVTPPEESTVQSVTIYPDPLTTAVVVKPEGMITYGGLNLTGETPTPHKHKFFASGGLAAWDLPNTYALTFTLAEEFLKGFDGNATITVEYVDASSANAELIYRTKDGVDKAHGTLMSVNNTNTRDVKTVTYELNDAAFKDTWDLGFSFMFRIGGTGRFYIKSVTVTKAGTPEPGTTYTLDLTSESNVADLKFMDETPFDLNLNAITDGNIEVVTATYSLTGGNLAEAVTGTKTVTLNKEGVNVLDAAWFNENAEGFGEFTLEVALSSEEETIASKTFSFSRDYTSILSSNLTSATAENKDGVLVFEEDAAMDLELFLKNKLAVPFSGTLTYTVSYNGTAVEGFEGLTAAITDMSGDAAKVEISLPEATAYGIYELAISVADAEGNEVHTNTFSFARAKAHFVNVHLLSTTQSAILEFVDETPYDLKLYAQKTDGFDENLLFTYEILKGEESVKSGSIDADITAAHSATVSLADILADVTGFGEFTLNVTVTNTLGYTEDFSFNFSRVESIKVELTSATHANLIFKDDEAYDLKLSLQKLLGEDGVYSVNYMVYRGEFLVDMGFFADVSVTETANVLDLDLSGLAGNGVFTLTATLNDSEGNTVKTVSFQFIRTSSIEAKILFAGNEVGIDLPTFIDLVTAQAAVSLKKPVGETEAMTVNYSVVDKDGNVIYTGTVTKNVGTTAVNAVLDLTTVTEFGNYTLNATVVDAAGNEIATASANFARVETVTTGLTSETNADLVFTEGEEWDMVLHLQKDGDPEDFKSIIVITDQDGNKLVEKNVGIPSGGKTYIKASLGAIVDLSTLPATGAFTLSLKVGDAQNRLREDAVFHFSRVAKDGSVEAAIKSPTTPDLVYAVGSELDMQLFVQKTDNIAEGFDALLIVTDKDGNELGKLEGALNPFVSRKLALKDLVDLTNVTSTGAYNVYVKLTDNSGNVRHESNTTFTVISLEGSIDLQVGSTTNPDLIYTEGEAFDLGLIMRKTDGVAEAFKATLTITDKDGNELKSKTVNVPAQLEIKTAINNLIDLSDLPATGSFKLSIVMIDAASNERAKLDTIFHRVKLASLQTQVSSNTNKDMIFTDKDPVDLNLYAMKIDDVPEELILYYSVLDPNGNEIATAEGKTVVKASPGYFKQAIDIDPALLTAHGIYKVILMVMDNSGNIRSETETSFARISGTGIKHQVSGSGTGTKMQFTPNMKIDLCLFAQKTDGVAESVQASLAVTSPSGAVIFSINGKLNIPNTGYFKFALPLDGKCTEFGTYKVSYTFYDDAGNLRVSNVAQFRMISPTGELAVAVQSASGKFPGMIYGKDDVIDLALYIQKADGVEQTLQLRYTIYDMNGLVLETKQGNINAPASGYRKLPIELPDIEAFQKYGVFTMKVEVAGPTGELIYNENFSFSRVLVPEKQLSVMGVCTHLSKRGMTVKQSQQYVDLARMAGISFWRDELPWSTVEPAKGQYRIPDSADAAVDYTLSIGLEPLFILDYGNTNYGSDVTTDEWLEGYLGYVEYVVTHFKGRIKYYEVWNEWNIGLGGLDKKYRDFPELYARILIPTYKLIKEIDPSITVIGGVVAGGDEEWTEELLKCEGAIDAMDVFSYHEYPDNDVKEFIDQAETIRELLTKYGRPDLPMWVTETGFPTHVGRNSFTEETSAGNLVSLFTWAIANPDVVDQIFWYDLHNDGVERENGEHNFGLLRNWDADVENVPLAAKPSYVALCAMNAILGDAEYVGMYDMGHRKITAYHFKKDGKDLLVTWADDAALNMIANVGENNIIVTDMYGNASALNPVDGKVSLFFSDAPIYIEYDLSQKLDMVEGGFTLDKDLYTATPAAVFPVKITRNNGLETQSGSYAFSMPDTWSVEGIEFGAAEAGATEITDTVYVTVGDDAAKGEMTITARVIIGGNVVGQFNVPIEMGDICTVNPDVVFTENGAEFKVSVQILNENSTKPLSGTINLLAPEELLGEASSAPFEIPAGENQAVLIDVPAEYANTYHTVQVEVVLNSGVKHEVTKPMSFLYAIEAPEGMKLDGVIDEQWDGAMEFTIGEEDWFNDVSYDTEWPGNTAKGYAMWDNEYLYVAVEVYDASHYQIGSGASIWMFDSIQMTTDVSRFTVPAYYGYNEIGYSLNSETGAIENWNWFASPGKNVSEGGIFKIVRDDATETTTYEVALPWSELLPKEIEFGFRSLGFALIVNDNSLDEDGEPTGRTGWIEYMSGIGYRKEPEKFGDLILVKRSEIQ